MLNFLKEIPDKYIMLIVFVMIFIAYLTSQLSMLEQLTFMAFGGLTTLLGVKRMQSPDVSTQSGDISLNQDGASTEKVTGSKSKEKL